MDKNVIDKRSKEWGESKTSLIVGAFLILSMGMNLYDYLVHGCMLKIQSLFDLGTTGQVLYLVCLGSILLMASDAIRGNRSKEHRLKLFPLLIQAGLAGVLLLYLGLLIGILLKMFIVEIIET
jgi:hypothetical protein